MVTKGVASVRSPVCNLQQFSHEITHNTFTNAIVREFQNEYEIDTPVRMLKFDRVLV
jgi:lipoate-protein ligase A